MFSDSSTSCCTWYVSSTSMVFVLFLFHLFLRYLPLQSCCNPSCDHRLNLGDDMMRATTAATVIVRIQYFLSLESFCVLIMEFVCAKYNIMCTPLHPCAQVVSWDEAKGAVDTNHEDGRSYISAVSELIYDPSQNCNGTAKVWSSMHHVTIGRCGIAISTHR